jgi:glycosyltransferase involved in cell wall biosynthesis
MTATLSIIIPAYNEEKYLPACLAAIERSIAVCESPIQAEIIVVDNDSTDKTAEIAKETGAKVVTEMEHRISKVRNAGGRAALGDYLLFIDADTVIAESALSEVAKLLETGKAAGGGAYVRYDVGGTVAIAAWFINHVVARFGRAWGTFLFCQSAAFKKIGGFDETMYGMEELVFSEALGKYAKANGLKFRIIPKYLAVTSGRRIKSQLKQLFRQPRVLMNPRKHMQNPDVCRPVWYDEDR